MYTALYRKYRPRTFAEVVGQSHVVRTLKNEINNNTFAHAYLFCGTRGTGKTSIARIFAKAVNCLDNKGSDPCGKCENCKAFDEGTFMDIYEIDAASNNSVDNIRDIRDNVIYPPTMGKYKIYIIDEVHMLSTSAFNAFLKTLEEPPEYAVFILATTDPQKIPATILSRCQRFDFRRISDDDMRKHLNDIASKEGVKVEDNALSLIVSKADGAARDALSLLDKCISYCGDLVTHDDALEVLGVLNDSVLVQFSDALLHYDLKKALYTVENAYISGKDVSQFLDEIITHFRNLLMYKIGGLGMEEYSSGLISDIKRQVKEYNENRLIRCIEVLSNAANQIKWAAVPKVLVEVAIVKLCKPEVEDSADALRDRVEKLELMVQSGDIPKSSKDISGAKAAKASKTDESMSDMAAPSENKIESADMESKSHVERPKVSLGQQDIKSKWPLLLDVIKKEKMALYVFLKNAVPSYKNNAIIVEVDRPIFRDALKKSENREFISSAINRIFGAEIPFDSVVKKQEADPKQKMIDQVVDYFGKDKVKIIKE